jgi:hypothetical protein
MDCRLQAVALTALCACANAEAQPSPASAVPECVLTKTRTKAVSRVAAELVRYEQTQGNAISLDVNVASKSISLYLLENTTPGTKCHLGSIGDIEPPAICAKLSKNAIGCSASAVDIMTSDIPGALDLLLLFVVAHEYHHIQMGDGKFYVNYPRSLELHQSLRFKLEALARMCSAPALDVNRVCGCPNAQAIDAEKCADVYGARVVSWESEHLVRSDQMSPHDIVRIWDALADLRDMIVSRNGDFDWDIALRVHPVGEAGKEGIPSVKWLCSLLTWNTAKRASVVRWDDSHPDEALRTSVVTSATVAGAIRGLEYKSWSKDSFQIARQELHVIENRARADLNREHDSVAAFEQVCDLIRMARLEMLDDSSATLADISACKGFVAADPPSR